MGSTNWMASYPNNYLSQLSIPGTHDSAAYKNDIPTVLSKFLPNDGILAITQDGTILDQLTAGVRFLDIRLRSVNDRLYAYHGGTPQIKFETVLQSINQFLTSNPTEGIIVNVQKDDGFTIPYNDLLNGICAIPLVCTDEGSERIDLSPYVVQGVDNYDSQFFEKQGNSWVFNPSDGNLNSNLNSYLEKYVPPSGYYTSNDIPRVSDIRQKIQLITDQSDIKSGVDKVAIEWSGTSGTTSLDNGSSLYVQNDWTEQLDAKYHTVHDTMEAANDDSDMKKLYLNWANTTAPSDGTPTSPIVSSSTINNRLLGTLSSAPRWYKMGVIVYDFINNPWFIEPYTPAMQTFYSNKNYSSESDDQLLEKSPDELTAKTPVSIPKIKQSRRRPGRLIMKYSNDQDRIIGTSHSERIRARKGNDFINSGSGDDIINGGKGTDSFVLSKGNNIIKDFKAGEFLLVDNERFDDIKLRQKGDDLLVKVKNYSSTLLLGQELKDFDASCIIPASVTNLF